MKTKKEIENIIYELMKEYIVLCSSEHPLDVKKIMELLSKETLLIQKEAYLQGQLDEFKENQVRTNKLLERFGI